MQQAREGLYGICFCRTCDRALRDHRVCLHCGTVHMIYGGTLYLGRKLRSRMIGKIRTWYLEAVDAGLSDEANATLGYLPTERPFLPDTDTFGDVSDVMLREIYEAFHKRQRARAFPHQKLEQENPNERNVKN
jgi:hypothetical protein